MGNSVDIKDCRSSCEWCGSENDVQFTCVDGKGGYLCKECREYMGKE